MAKQEYFINILLILFMDAFLPQAPALMTHVTAQRHITGDVSANAMFPFSGHIYFTSGCLPRLSFVIHSTIQT